MTAIKKYLFSPGYDEGVHNWPRNGDIVETVVASSHLQIPGDKFTMVTPHRDTKYPKPLFAVVLKTSLQEIKP